MSAWGTKIFELCYQYSSTNFSLANQLTVVIIVGGGIAGSVLASRLHAHLPFSSILLIEAGSDLINHPLITDRRNAGELVGSELD